MNKKHKDQLIGNGLDIFTGLVNAGVVFVKASPILLIIYILFINPNC